MSYSDFSLEELKTKFGLIFIQNQSLFSSVPVHEVSADLIRLLQYYLPLALAIDTEKARSELLLMPILAALKFNHSDTISLFSGIEFNIDKEAGLVGRCDFILSRSADQYSLTAPVAIVVEAKNDNIKSGIPQCGAEMIAAQRFNQQKNNAIEIIYGCVSTGTNWKFLKLMQNYFYIDPTEYYIESLEKIMGILVNMVCID